MTSGLEDRDGRLRHVLSHELRMRIVELAQLRRTVSAVELARELDAPLSTVAYHVRRLGALRMLELDHETRARGAVCRHYRLSADGVGVGRLLDTLAVAARRRDGRTAVRRRA
jgi:DNA-binding transcriptional ArsR family regulator